MALLFAVGLACAAVSARSHARCESTLQQKDILACWAGNVLTSTNINVCMANVQLSGATSRLEVQDFMTSGAWTDEGPDTDQVFMAMCCAAWLLRPQYSNGVIPCGATGQPECPRRMQVDFGAGMYVTQSVPVVPGMSLEGYGAVLKRPDCTGDFPLISTGNNVLDDSKEWLYPGLGDDPNQDSVPLEIRGFVVDGNAQGQSYCFAGCGMINPSASNQIKHACGLSTDATYGSWTPFCDAEFDQDSQSWPTGANSTTCQDSNFCSGKVCYIEADDNKEDEDPCPAYCADACLGDCTGCAAECDEECNPGDGCGGKDCPDYCKSDLVQPGLNICTGNYDGAVSHQAAIFLKGNVTANGDGKLLTVVEDINCRSSAGDCLQIVDRTRARLTNVVGRNIFRDIIAVTGAELDVLIDGMTATRDSDVAWYQHEGHFNVEPTGAAHAAELIVDGLKIDGQVATQVRDATEQTYSQVIVSNFGTAQQSIDRQGFPGSDFYPIWIRANTGGGNVQIADFVTASTNTTRIDAPFVVLVDGTIDFQPLPSMCTVNGCPIPTQGALKFTYGRTVDAGRVHVLRTGDAEGVCLSSCTGLPGISMRERDLDYSTGPQGPPLDYGMTHERILDGLFVGSQFKSAVAIGYADLVAKNLLFDHHEFLDSALHFTGGGNTPAVVIDSPLMTAFGTQCFERLDSTGVVVTHLNMSAPASALNPICGMSAAGVAGTRQLADASQPLGSCLSGDVHVTMTAPFESVCLGGAWHALISP